ncbi:type II secretion system major pseudopilin GspG [Rheinheimera gaetbuli]
MKVKQTRGFTLIELLIVIVILGLLASIVAPGMFSKVDSSKTKTAEAQIKLLQTSLDTYRLDMGRYPASLDDLLKGDHPNWDGPYFPQAIPLDPWGNPYVYRTPGRDSKPYDLISYGSDGREGGEDTAKDVAN